MVSFYHGTMVKYILFYRNEFLKLCKKVKKEIDRMMDDSQTNRMDEINTHNYFTSPIRIWSRFMLSAIYVTVL